MTDVLAQRPTVAPEIAEVAERVVALMRSFNRSRTRMLAAAAHDVEWSAQVLLKCLANEGPMRAGTLAEYVHSDPSTVSRQVAALVKDGLLERRADPIDGRASLLVLTARADDVLAAQDELRLQHFARMLANWSEDELQQFAGLLQRFTTDFETAHHEALAERAAGAAHANNQQGRTA